jgi:hypothetical protein
MAADPEPKAPAATVDKPADWSKFVNVGEISGEVIKADESGFTVRVTWYGPKGGTNTRPQLSRGGGNQSRQQRTPQMVAQHHDYMLKYADNGLVRQLKLPPKTNEQGKKVEYTVKELENAKKPAGMPYYAAARTELAVGSTVEVHLVRSRDIPAAKAQESDILVKYVVMQTVGKGTASSDTKK